jgi:glycine/D-amino acid oxidase-like deaminating enzyme
VTLHTPEGWWLEEAGGTPEPAAPLAGDVRADVLVVGGGYLGMWTAWNVLEHEPQARVVVLEAGLCGHGPSGRNGGMANPFTERMVEVREAFGDNRARALLEASQDAVRGLGSWCEANGVDAWYLARPHLDVSTSPAQDGGWEASAEALAALGQPGELAPGSPAELAAICSSPAFREGAIVKTAATVQPGRLALGLRDRLMARGAAVHERSRVRALRAGRGGVVAETASGRVIAGQAVLAIGGAALGVRPLHGRISVASSHIVLTEPVPDVLEACGWTGGEGITDRRTLLHYFRTTRDGRIALGWGGGRMGFGSRTDGVLEVDPDAAAHARTTLLRFFPGLKGRSITHAWGGPIDVGPDHLPIYGTVDPGVHYGFGFTGNGVAPSYLGGRILAAIALDRRDPVTRLPIVEPHPKRFPPEPFRWAGGSAIRTAFVRRDRLEEEGRGVDPLTAFVTSLPKRLGMNLPR